MLARIATPELHTEMKRTGRAEKGESFPEDSGKVEVPTYIRLQPVPMPVGA